MLYENYEARVQNIAKVRDIILKYKVLIIILLVCLFTSISALTFVNGMITTDLSDVSSIQYGDDLILEAKVLFGEADFEFRKVENTRSTNEWSSVEPILPGTYEVRVVSSRSFGISSTGQAVSFTIAAKNSDIVVSESSIQYGDDFSFTADLNEGDTFVEFGVLFEDFKLQTEVTPDVNNIKIINLDNIDVTSAYNFTVIEKEITFIPRTIEVNVINQSKVYDGLEFTSNEFSSYNLLADHTVNVDISGSIKNIGTVSNIINNVDVMCGDLNISHMYNTVIKNGTLTVEKRDVIVTTSDASLIYDGTYLESLSYEIENLIEGEEVSIVSSSSIKYFGEINNVLEVDILNGDNINNYNVIYVYGKLNILKRDLTITTNTNSNVYDGTDFYDESFEVTSNTLVENDYFIVDEHTTIKYFGKTSNILQIEVYNDINISDSYNISYVYGELSITKRDIIVESVSSDFVYNDTPQGDFEHTTNNIVLGNTTKVISYSTLVEVGTIDNDIIVEMYDGEKNISDCYFITYNPGTIEIIKREVNISTGNKTKTYDGVPLIEHSWYYLNDVNTFVDGHDFDITITGTITNVNENIIGFSNNTYSNYTLTKNGIDVLKNYQLNITEGLLTIKRREVTIVTGSASKVYDDTELIEHSYSFKDGSYDLVLDHELSITYTGTITNVINTSSPYGFVDNEAHDPLITSNGIDVTENYMVVIEFGELKITPLMISISSLESTKIYDGLQLEKNGIYDWKYLGDARIVEGHDLQVINTTSITNVGEVANKISTWTIYKNFDIDVTSNYLVATSTEKLSITKRPIEITTGSNLKVYDDTELIEHSYSYDEGSLHLVLDHTFEITYTGTITFVGKIENTYSNFSILSSTENLKSNYEVTISFGNLTVEKRDVSVTTQNGEYIYNGEIQYNEIYSIENKVDSHTTKIDVVTGEKNVTDNGLNKYTIIILNANGDVTSNYNIEYTYNTLIINKRVVIIETDSDFKTYDGTALVKDSWSYVSEMEFVEKHTFNISITGSITNVLIENDKVIGIDNTYSNFTIYDQDEDVSSNYDIKVNQGELKILQKVLNVLIGSAEKVYDGELLVKDSFKFINDTSTVNSEELTFDIISELINVDKIDNDYDANTVVVTKENGEDSTNNYDIVISLGTLEIFVRNIYIETNSNEKVYDGVVLEDKDYFYYNEDYKVLENLGHYLDINITGSIINVGTTTNNVSSAPVVKYSNHTENDNYCINLELGTLEVTHRNIHITTGSDSKVYDGYALTNTTITYSDDYYQLVNDNNIIHTLSSTMDSYIIHVGVIANTIEDIIIKDQDDIDVTDNYKIVIVLGTLTIIQRDITITTQEAQKEYDGLELFNKELLISEKGLVSNDRVEIDTFASITLVEVLENIITIKILNGDEDITANYKINYVYDVYLTITQREITLSTDSHNFVYNGKLFSDKNYSLSKVIGAQDELKNFTYTEVYEANTYINELSFDIFKGDINVNYCYKITNEFGEIQIDKYKTTYQTGSDKKEYDGTILFNEDLSIDLAETDYYTIINNTKVQYWSAETVYNKLEFYIYNDEFGDVTSNYEFLDCEYGILEILKREIVITTDSDEFEYDGDVHKVENSKFSNEFVESDGVIIIYENSIINVGSIKNSISYTLTNTLATDSYKIEVVEGDITIYPRAVEILIDYAEKEYDGTKLTCDTFTADRFVSGQSITIETDGSIINAGEIDNNYINGSEKPIGETILSNYTFTFVSNSLKINPKVIIIKTASDEKEYDGFPLTNSGTSYNDLVGFDQISYTVDGSQTERGVSLNFISEVTFTIGDANNYELKYEFGTLIVYPPTIVIITEGITVEYRDEEISNEKYKIEDKAGNELNLELISITFLNTIRDVGEIPNEVDQNSIVIDSTDSYSIEFVFGILKVIPREVHVTSLENLNIEYSGEYQSYFRYDTEGDFISSHHLFERDAVKLLEFDDKTYKNYFIIDIFKEVDGEMIDVSENYAITYDFNDIKIARRSIDVSVKDGYVTYSYNGEEQGLKLLDMIIENRIDFHSVELTSSYRLLPGISDLSYSIKLLDEEMNDVSKNYIINYIGNEEKIEITKAVVVVTTATEEAAYTGLPFSSDLCVEVDGNIASTDKFLFTNTRVEISIGVYENTYDGYIITSPHITDDITIDDLYQIEISSVLGTLTIYKAELLVALNDDEKNYDGTPLVNAEWYYKDDTRLPDGHTLTYYDTTEITDVIYDGDAIVSAKNTFGYYIITNESGEEVTDYINLTTLAGDLLIRPLDVLVKLYDLNKPVQSTIDYINTYDDYKFFSIETNIYGHTFTTRAEESGTLANIKLFDYTFTKDGIDKTGNFNVVQEGGFITFERRTITITAGSIEAKYTGQIVYISDYEITGQGIRSGHTEFVRVTGAGFKIGVYDNVITSVSIKDSNGNELVEIDEDGNLFSDYYIINLEKGTIKIT